MNQHIIKLVRQALNECVSTPVESVIASRIDDHGIVEIPNTFAEKFAQLIVRECIDKITTYDLVPGHSAKWEDIYDIHTRLLQDLGQELKEHFGVEE